MLDNSCDLHKNYLVNNITNADIVVLDRGEAGYD
jgi:hypothetical protein